MSNVDGSFVQKFFNITKRKVKPDVHHDGQANDLRRCFEIAKWIGTFHLEKVESGRLAVTIRFLLTIPGHGTPESIAAVDLDTAPGFTIEDE